MGIFAKDALMYGCQELVLSTSLLFALDARALIGMFQGRGGKNDEK